MAFKQFPLSDGESIIIYKRRGARSLRLSVTADGIARVTIPTWAPYSAGIDFAEQRLAWIRQQQPGRTILEDGQPIGKAHRLRFVALSTNKVSTRIKATEIIISHPQSFTSQQAAVQQAASRASVRALRRQAEQLLPQRLTTLAEQHQLPFASVHIKQLKSRWGSCDQRKNIVLNLYLMQLPWHLIDYVLLHELTHTLIMQHGPKFWQALEVLEPRAKALRKEIRTYRPILGG